MVSEDDDARSDLNVPKNRLLVPQSEANLPKFNSSHDMLKPSRRATAAWNNNDKDDQLETKKAPSAINDEIGSNDGYDEDEEVEDYDAIVQ